MKDSIIREVVLAVVLALLFTALPGHAGADDQLLGMASKLKKNLLKNKGYEVRGKVDYSRFVSFDTIQAYCQGLIPSCNGYNVNAPYLLAKVPELPDQAPTSLPYSFRLRGNEAVVLVGPTPPPCDYYSYVCYLFNRYEEGWGPVDSHKIFSSLGDPLNRFTLKTGTRNFNQNIVLIFTPDKKTEKAVRKAAEAAGFSPDVINTYVIPSSLYKTNTALDKTTDELLILQRTALWRDGTDDGGGYIESPGTVVFRVTPPSQRPVASLPTPEQRVRGTGKTELDLAPAVDKLREAILARYPGLPAQELITSQAVPQSPLALQTMTNTLGDSSDSPYLLTQDTFKLSDDHDDFLVIYGVNHEMTRKAVYQNIAIYRAFKFCGVAAAFSHCYGSSSCVSLSGSADQYLPNPSGIDVDKLYALKVARDCGDDPHCLEVPTGGCGVGVELDDDLHAAVRAYVEPKTKTGPSYTELLFDRVIHFTPSAGPSLHVFPFFEADHSEGVTVPFSVSSSGGGDVNWEVKIEYLDDMCCGKMEPDRGVISGGNGEAAFTFRADYPGIYSLTLTVKDPQSRVARTEVKIKMTAVPD